MRVTRGYQNSLKTLRSYLLPPYHWRIEYPAFQKLYTWPLSLCRFPPNRPPTPRTFSQSNTLTNTYFTNGSQYSLLMSTSQLVNTTCTTTQYPNPALSYVLPDILNFSPCSELILGSIRESM